MGLYRRAAACFARAVSTGGHRDLAGRSLSATWLSTRLGVDRVRLAGLARSGTLIGFRPEGSQELSFPAWQFNGGARPLDALPRIREAARRVGMDDARLCRVMDQRVGLGGRERLSDLARQGRIGHVLACIQLAGARTSA
jgi:hypothetical protein